MYTRWSGLCLKMGKKKSTEREISLCMEMEILYREIPGFKSIMHGSILNHVEPVFQT